MRRIRQVWQLRLRNPPEVEAVTGKKFTVFSLGKDTGKAIAEAERIRRSARGERGASSGELDELAYEFAKDDSEDALYAREDIAEKIAEARSSSSAEASEKKALAWYRKAAGRDADLKKLAEHNRDIISDKTYSARIEAINRAGLQWLSDVPDRKAATKVCDELLARGLSRSTVALTVKTLNTIWRIAVDKGIIVVSPFERMGVRVPVTEKRPLTPKELMATLEACSDDLTWHLITALALTGLRIGEQLRVGLGAIEHGDVLTVGKAKTAAGVRKVILSPKAQVAMKAILKAGPLRYDAAHRMISTAYKDAKILDADVHSLRRTCARALSESDIPEHVAAAMLGHRHRSISYGLYARGVSEDLLREAALAVERYLFAPPTKKGARSK